MSAGSVLQDASIYYARCLYRRSQSISTKSTVFGRQTFIYTQTETQYINIYIASIGPPFCVICAIVDVQAILLCGFVFAMNCARLRAREH